MRIFVSGVVGLVAGLVFAFGGGSTIDAAMFALAFAAAFFKPNVVAGTLVLTLALEGIAGVAAQLGEPMMMPEPWETRGEDKGERYVNARSAFQLAITRFFKNKIKI